MVEVMIMRMRSGGLFRWPWYESAGSFIIQADGYRVDGDELRHATMLEF
jgi:hypothetical protein